MLQRRQLIQYQADKLNEQDMEMQMMNSANKYGLISRALHWTNAFLLIVVYIVSDFDDDSALFYWGHILAGLGALGFTIAHLVWHFVDKRLDELPGLPKWRKLAIDLNHWLIMLTALLGSSTGIILWRTDRLEDFHEFLSVVLILLFIMHVGGALLYQFTKGDSLSRMA